MMKKLLLALFAINATYASMAQSAATSIIFDNPQQTHSPMQNKHGISSNETKLINGLHTNPLARTTTEPGKWYSHYLTVNKLLGDAFFPASGTPPETWEGMWWDSTVTKRYSNGVFANEMAGACQTFDPIRYRYYNDPTVSINNTTDIAVQADKTYIVDTIQIRAVYVHRPARPSSVRDTLIISVSPQANDFYYDSTGHNWLHNNPGVPPTDTILFSAQPKYADSVHRAAFPDVSTAGYVQTLDTIILNPSVDGHLPDLTSHPGQEFDTLTTYQFVINHGLGNTIPAGAHFAVTVSFKSGDTWVQNVDSINKFSTFQPVYSFEGTSTAATWMTYWLKSDTGSHDYNGSSYIDSRGRNNQGIPDHWVSEFVVQDANNFSTGWPTQYMQMSAHVNCPTCITIAQLAVPNVVSAINTVKAYPNPANNELNVPFILNQSSAVSVSLTNVIGQVISTQNMGKVTTGKAVFNTTAIPGGVYFYTLTAGAERTTGRVVITH
ncbi:MAG: T9SS type A sorting domain-containing protein [Taibaiella sp.]|nr:T9SS type A sorting domain-containing protein [Taibaiella sp.]